MKVSDLMTRDVSTCRPSSSLREAAQRMKDHDCGSIPVVDEDDSSSVVGMITDRDICMAALRTGKRLEDVEVSEAMTDRVLTCSPEAALSDAERIMSDARVRRLPVIDEQGQLQGLLSI